MLLTFNNINTIKLYFLFRGSWFWSLTITYFNICLPLHVNVYLKWYEVSSVFLIVAQGLSTLIRFTLNLNR